MHVPFLDLKAQYRQIRPDVERAVRRVFESQRFVLGKTVETFERRMARLAGTRHAVGVASGSDALYMALASAGVGAGDRVLVPAFSFFATAGAVSRLGAEPVFVDIGPRTFNLDGVQLLRAVASMAPEELVRVKAVIPVHLFGQCADMRPVLEVAQRFRWAVVEDAAQAVGARHRGRPAGSLGDAGCFSFYPTKNLGGAGDGGAVTTDSARLAKHLREMRDHGQVALYRHRFVGLNSRLDALQAAVLLVKARHLEKWNRARRALARRYDARLADVSEIETPVCAQSNTHTYHQYTVRAKRRNALREHLARKGVDTQVYYPVPLPHQPCYQEAGRGREKFPESERASREVLALPVYPGLSRRKQDYVIRCLRTFYGRK
ncbi:MAG: DegT/DnrJ/EryC1/StrS family aminotransferase [Acidobacteriota bacterium]|nr:MAG: DegT/DnrJ/EryC1/StrS family aminotransferase [Acidobacteriota bacterium]